jgi:predicted flap endonuclease-1-like 5' DNA nuclease
MYGETLFLHTLAQLPCFIWFALIPLLIGILIGWLLRQGRISSLSASLDQQKKELEGARSELNTKSAEFTSLKYRHDDLEKDNRGLRTSLNSAQADLELYRSRIQELESKLGVEASPLLGAQGATKVYKDYDQIFSNTNLQVIEGIGPKIEEVLKGNDVNSWEDIASKSEEELRAVLAKGGEAYRIHNPSTWPKQAQMAADGEWEKLIEYQKGLDVEKNVETDKENPAKVERLVSFLATAEDDLQVVEGIGPQIERTLNGAGIRTLSQLAEKTPDEIREILSVNPRFKLANPKTWPRQASLAAEGKWEELKEYQDYLEGGVDPADK